MDRLQLRAQILMCSGCALHKNCTPVPFDGPTPATLAVIGEAPGLLENEIGKPFQGPAGQHLRRLLTEEGFDLSTTIFMNAVSCYPIDHAGKGRTPNALEVAACAGNLKAQMELSGASYFLVVGGVALTALRPGLKISVARGVPFLFGGSQEAVGDRLVLPTFHPSYLLRKGEKEEQLVREDLQYLRRLMEVGPDNWLPLFPDTCILCSEWVYRWDDDGIGWCNNHWTARWQ